MFASLLMSVCLLGAADDPAAAKVNAQIETTLKQLPGRTGFAFTELTADGIRPIYQVRADDRFAVGSSFKLFILGELAVQSNAGRRDLANVMRLRKDLEGPPHSEMAEWPADSPVTLQTLALKMISISDNTATDHLLYLLGREAIERQMAAMGHSHPQWNRPLLSTREMTMLRDEKQGLPGKAYQKLDEAAKRKFLADHFQGVPDYESLDFDTRAYDIAEWYATPLDMARALAWLQKHTTDEDAAQPLRTILTVDPKLPHDPAVWPFVGFKGGSEDQLLAGNWLLKNKNGRWYTMHMYWNNPDKKVDQALMLKALQSIFEDVQHAIR